MARRRPLPSRAVYRRHLLRAWGAAGTLLIVSLGVGTLGYHLTERIPWIDALLGASMILTGMGPTAIPTTTCGKLFATGYALFSGVVFLTITGLLVAPVLHRFLHRFHLELEEGEEEK
jgi:hypothetical protein